MNPIDIVLAVRSLRHYWLYRPKFDRARLLELLEQLPLIKRK